MIKLDNVTIICVDTLNYGLAISALKKSLQQVTPARCVLLTNIELQVEGIEVIKIDTIKSKNGYSRFMIKELYKHFDTKFVLVIQHDGFILCGESWTDEFLNYDYIGARWCYPSTERNVGNGGFSLRSHKLQLALGTDDFIEVTEQEDECISRLYGSYLEQTHGIKFSPEEIADKFSFELNEPTQNTLGFHGYFHEPYKKSIVIIRKAALGDVIMCEPIIDYYFKKGYQVYLDTLPQFMSVFFQYRHPLKHIDQMNRKIVTEKTINLDMSYESKPQQPVLKTYYEFAGITDGEFKNSQLDLLATKDEMLFDKYILIHADSTGLPHRDQHGIDWNFVVNYYQRLGYQVFQIGKRTQEIVAPFLNTASLQMLLFAIKGATVLIGIDSSPAQIAVALGVPSVIMFGSVNSVLRYSDFSKIQVIHTSCPSGKERYCYHEETGTTGQKCEHNELLPPCSLYTHFDVLNAVNKLL